MTALYLAWSPSGEARETFRSLAADPTAPAINLLVSYVYLSKYDASPVDRQVKTALTMLDSGAFSAWKSGKVIDLDALIAETQTGRWGEAVALDVIGDPTASLANALRMKQAGSPAYPVFHYGEPWEVLAEYRRQFPKVGLSCRFGEPVGASTRWVEQCFARAWPYPFHSFGWVSDVVLLRFPFHSADTASWNTPPSAWGSWRAFGKMSVRGTKNLRAEIDSYLRLQRTLAARWAKELSPWTPSISASPSPATAGSPRPIST